MTRRSLLALGVSLGLVGGAGLALAGPAARSWRGWKDRFVASDGRVVDFEQGAVSHSEGQAYGLLLAQAFGDRETFEAIETWTTSNLDIRDDALMAWRWTPGRAVAGQDWHSATDGDLLRAWALLRAHRDSRWGGATQRWRAIVADIANLLLVPDPRASDELLLIPSAEARSTPARVLLNPSYIMPRALRELGQAAGDPRLIRAADHGETCLRELAAAGFLPDWIDVVPDGYAPPLEHDLRSAYDAIRIPLYLVWSGRRSHPAVALAARLLRQGAKPNHLVVARDASGAPPTTATAPGFGPFCNCLTAPQSRRPPTTCPTRPIFPQRCICLRKLHRAKRTTVRDVIKTPILGCMSAQRPGDRCHGRVCPGSGFHGGPA